MQNNLKIKKKNSWNYLEDNFRPNLTQKVFFNHDGKNQYYSIMNFFFICLLIHNLLKFIHYIQYPTSFPFNPVTTKDSINAFVPGCCD